MKGAINLVWKKRPVSRKITSSRSKSKNITTCVSRESRQNLPDYTPKSRTDQEKHTLSATSVQCLIGFYNYICHKTATIHFLACVTSYPIYSDFSLVACVGMTQHNESAFIQRASIRCKKWDHYRGNGVHCDIPHSLAMENLIKTPLLHLRFFFSYSELHC